MTKSGSLRISVGTTGSVSGLILRPDNASALLVFAHGAGAGMRHPFMETMAQKLAEEGVATLRYQFPYMEQGSRRPDPQPMLLATVRAAIETARGEAGTLPLFAGGKSMGGRMTSLAASKETLPDVRGIVFFGFPLHPPGKPGSDRATHLEKVAVPLLFLQGTRDTLADLTLLKPVCERLSHAELRIFEGADHSFNVLKSSGRTTTDVQDTLARTAGDWMARMRL